jgi:hypothetical protein
LCKKARLRWSSRKEPDPHRLPEPAAAGFALIAKEAGAPVQILFIRSDTRLFTRGLLQVRSMPNTFPPELRPVTPLRSIIPARRFAEHVEHVLRSGLETRGGPRKLLSADAASPNPSACVRGILHVQLAVDAALPCFAGSLPGTPGSCGTPD